MLASSGMGNPSVAYVVCAAIVAGAGCAHAPATPPTATAVSAYADVRSGRAARVETHAHLFCAEQGGVEVYPTRDHSGMGDWADKVRDSWIRRDVVEAVERDPALAQAHVEVELRRGQAFLRGTVPSAAAAVKAAEDALGVPGVVAVHTELTSPDVRMAMISPAATCF